MPPGDPEHRAGALQGQLLLPLDAEAMLDHGALQRREATEGLGDGKAGRGPLELLLGPDAVVGDPVGDRWLVLAARAAGRARRRARGALDATQLLESQVSGVGELGIRGRAAQVEPEIVLGAGQPDGLLVKVDGHLIVREELAIARVTAWRIHQVA